MLRPTVVEIVVFLVLAVASAGGFWIRFRKVLDRIRQSKPDADFSLTPIGPRIRDFIWEVVLQGKVIRERPLVGIAHAFVFWGFCSFALVTLNHFATGVGYPFLSHENWLARIYFYLAAAFGVTVAVSIAGLFIRRFFVRPKWLGEKLSYESGFIAFLIFTLMVTYLATFWIHDGDPGAEALWWSHTLALLIFMPLIPHTKHLHLVLSPVTVFLSRGGFSRIPPLAGDEDFGLDTGKDLTRIVSLQAYSCVECGRCSQHCPAYNTGKVLNPKEIALGLRSYLNELGPRSEEPLLGTHLSQEAAFQCTTCGACEFQCPLGIEHLPMIIGLRRGAVNTGKWEDDYGTKLFLALERNGNALGFSSSERDKFIQKQQFPIFDGTQEYCLWLGCMGAYDPQGREIVASFARVMEHLGTTYGVMKKEKCTGDPARRLGNDLVFQQLAEQNLESLKQSKAAKIVSICPHCVRTISTDWKEYGEAPPIEHHSEFMARHVDRLPSSAASGQKVVYHDPCYLGRYRGVYDEPRAVAGLAGEVIDPERSRERSFCCGAGGGLAFLGEEKGDRVSHNRAKELVATGAEIVGAACPFCNTMFRDALSAVSSQPPKLLDIAQIAAAGLPKRDKPQMDADERR
ncbi:MAG TPA: heterodisulfide reductase-related iron-sulfur binding cluster [Bryobacteraceae bacterium]|jgi:Fe-S oxidoreductase|nr:heterodisulfide reductase-related iron-sulfur binding cluster [Bryobacteraceae bacterium]